MSQKFPSKLAHKLLMSASLALVGAVPVAHLYPAYAQTTTASIHGTVTDSTGAVVPNAVVTVLNTSNGIKNTAKSDSKGYYAVPALQIGGPYTITITATGFSNFASSGLHLNVNDNPAIDGKLQVGSASQDVKVEANNVQVETAETQLKTDIGAKEITDLPLLGRDAAQLEKTAPGVMESSDRFGTFSANGAQTTQSDYLLDGADINDGPLQTQGITVNPDALSEEAIVTSTLNPEYSRNSGAVINETLKTGTNSFHGEAFEFYRDTFLNGGSYFSQTRPPFHQNLYGGTLGGPVIKDKLFFFLAYQGYRNRTGTTEQTNVFSSGQLAGGFGTDKNLLSTVNNNTSGGNGTPNSDGKMPLDGLSQQPMPFAVGSCAAGTLWNECPAFVSGQIPTAAFNSLSNKLVQSYVKPANNGTFYNFNTANTGAQDQGVIRIDYHLGQKDAFSASSIFQSAPDSTTLPFDGADLPGFAETDAAHIKIFNADWTHTFNSTTVNDLRAGYFRFNYAAVSPQTVTQPSSAGFAITPQDQSSASLPYIGVTGYFDLGFSQYGPQPRKDTNLLGSDVFTKVLGNHNIKMGATFEQFGVDNPFYSSNNGNYGFNGSGTYSSGDPAIDFLLAIPSDYTQESGSLIDAVSHEYYAFAQDNWKVSSSFTLNYGLAWDTETPWANRQFSSEAINCWQNSSATSKIYPGGAPGLLYPGDPGCTNYGAATAKFDHFGPRVGFDWSPDSGPSLLVGDSGSHSLAIRGGFGIYYNRDQEEEALQNLSAPPYLFESHGAADVGGSPAFANPYADVTGNAAVSEANVFPYVRPATGSALNWANYTELDLSVPDPKYTTPLSYNFNINIQKELPGRMVGQIGYVGSLGRHLPRVTEGDQITAAGHAACLADTRPTVGCANNLNDIHQLFPQYTAQPSIYPGSVSANQTNGIPWYLSVGDQTSDGSSSYHSLQASLVKQTSHGLYFTLAYTYSHALDDDSGYESSSGTGSPNGAGGSNGRSINFTPGYQSLNYGSSDYDARHRFVALYVYQVPLPHSLADKKLLDEAIGGWSVSGTTTFQTGFPVTLSESGVFSSGYCDEYSYYGCADAPNTSNFNIKSLNARSLQNFSASPAHYWFNPSPFSAETTGTFGNTPRNFFHGPGFNYTNLQLYKNFPIGGHESPRVLQIRLESYNVFNHANFAMPDGNFSDPTFGQISNVIQPNSFGGQATDPQPGRASQLSAKFTF